MKSLILILIVWEIQGWDANKLPGVERVKQQFPITNKKMCRLFCHLVTVEWLEYLNDPKEKVDKDMAPSRFNQARLSLQVRGKAGDQLP